MIIYMDDYRKASQFDAAQHEMEEEQLCVNWHPAVRVLALSCYQRPQELSPQLPPDLANVDADSFLDSVYGLATQI